MSFWVYILQSKSSGRFYCGQSNDLDKRVRQHNDPDYDLTKTTKRLKGPWEIAWKKECSSRSEALKLEKFIKKRGIARYLDQHFKS